VGRWVYHTGMGTPVAYLRKSRVIDERVGVSWEVQEGRVRELAALNGDNGGRLLILSDWNISGRKGSAARPGYRRLLEMIEADEVTAIYSYNLARLSRSVQDLRSLVALADAHRVPVRLVADQIDTSTATGRMLLTMLAAVDEMTADLASEHARDAVAARRARGDRIGHPFYGERAGEDAGAVVKAYQDAGSIMGAARLLNVRGVPTRMGGPWSTVSVRETLVRLGAYPNRTRPGAKARAPFAFYGLLRCHCGHILTGTRFRNGPQPLYTAYKCHLARSVPDHGPGSVPETRIMEWAKAAAARLRPPKSVEMEAVTREAERTALAGRRTVINDMYEANGPTWRDEYRRRLRAVTDAEERLADQEAAAIVVTVPAINWDGPPERINEVLRALWRTVQCGPDHRTFEAERIIPEWWA
jgi:DNA invertase Pin-like site-specific DNA recombinase